MKTLPRITQILEVGLVSILTSIIVIAAIFAVGLFISLQITSIPTYYTIGFVVIALMVGLLALIKTCSFMLNKVLPSR